MLCEPPPETSFPISVNGGSHLVHGEVREKDDKVLLHSDDEARVSLVAAGDDLHVVAHAEVFLQLVRGELQGILQTHTHTGE